VGGAGGGREDSGRLRSSKERAVRIGPASGEVGVLFTRLPPDGRIFGEPSGRSPICHDVEVGKALVIFSLAYSRYVRRVGSGGRGVATEACLVTCDKGEG
jgi:hypothetical protein